MILFRELQSTINNTPIDATIDSTAVIDNKLPIWNFFENIFLRKPANINILVYTIEGEPIIKKLNFDGEIIKYTYISGKYTKEYMGNQFKKYKKGSDIRYDLYYDNKFITEIIHYWN